MSRVEISATAVSQFLENPVGSLARDLEQRSVEVEAGAKRLCPVDTGRLRASISHELGRDPAGMYARIGTDVEYSIYVEVGTSKMNAQPYLRPALKESGQ